MNWYDIHWQSHASCLSSLGHEAHLSLLNSGMKISQEMTRENSSVNTSIPNEKMGSSHMEVFLMEIKIKIILEKDLSRDITG